jgi:hypothetical protein
VEVGVIEISNCICKIYMFRVQAAEKHKRGVDLVSTYIIFCKKSFLYPCPDHLLHFIDRGAAKCGANGGWDGGASPGVHKMGRECIQQNGDGASHQMVRGGAPLGQT